MFNKFKTTTLAAVTAATTLLGSGQAWAFGGVIPFTLDTNWAGTCGTLTLSNGTNTGHINLRPNSGGNYSPNSGRWIGGSIGTATGAITPAFLEAECGLSSVQNFSSTGPSGTYATDSYNGVSFRATDNATGVMSDYEYAISGVTNTVIIKTITPAPDTLPPTVTLSSASIVTSADPFTITATFVESVTGFDDISNDVNITNGTVTSISGSGRVYTITAVPVAPGNITVSIPSGAAQDLVGFQNIASTNVTVVYDPDVVLAELVGMPSTVTPSPFYVTVNFDKPVTGFNPMTETSDLNVSGATLTSVSGGPSSYTLTLTPTGAGVTVSVPAGAAQSPSGGQSIASNVVTANYNAFAISVNITGEPVALDGTNPFDVIIRFSEPVYSWSVSPASVSVTNGTATILGRGTPNGNGSYTEYTATITPDGNGDVVIFVPENTAFSDPTFFGNVVSPVVTVRSDATAPSVTLTGAPSTLNSTAAFTVTAGFSEVVTGFDATDIVVTNATVTVSGGPEDYTITVTPTGAGGVSITVPAAAAQDAASNDNTASNTLSATFDGTAPTVTLSSPTTTLTGTDPFTVTATFDEAVTGFNDLANDITIANGTVTGITAVSATVYTLAVTPTGAGDVSITVPAAAAQDAASNDNTASNTLVIGNTIVEDTQKAIADFMLGRANNLASNQPGLKRFLPGTFQNTFYAAVTRGNGTLSGAFAQGNTWAELTGSWSGDDNYALGSFGAHSFVNPNLLIGGMLQFDYAEDSANNASGNGYMVGPYFVAQVPDQPLFLEGRLLYGQTDNKISPLGTYTDSFEAERWLAQVRATGKYQYMATTLRPLLDLTYTDDSQKAYTDSLGNVIPGQTVSLMQVSAGMDFSTPISVPTGALELTGGLSGIYSASDGAAAAPEFENWRGRTHLGLNYGMTSGANLSATTFYDGLGTDYESYGASLGFDRKF